MPFHLRVTLSIWPVVLLAYLYVGWKLYHSVLPYSPVPKEHLRLALISVGVFLNLHALLFLLSYLTGLEDLSRAIAHGNKIWDWLFTYPFWTGVIIVVELLPWFILTDFIKLPFYPFYSKLKSDWLSIQGKVIVALFAVIFIYSVCRIVIDTNRIKVTRLVFSHRLLPASLDGFRMAHISDVQADPRTGKRKLNRYMKKVNMQKPDLVLFTGDLVTSGTKYIEAGAESMGRLQAPQGVLACAGDHDIWSDLPAIKAELQANGIRVHEDKNHFVKVGTDSLLLTFLTNTYNRRPTLDRLNFLAGSQPRGVLDILVTHQPSEDIVEIAAERGYHLFLAGHSHGGQIVFKPFGWTFTPSRFESRFFKGSHYVENMLVSINNGLGFTLVPLRFRAPAEITIIELRKAG